MTTEKQNMDAVMMCKTTAQNEITVLIDWLSFTMWDLSVRDVMEQILGFSCESFVRRGERVYGYRTRYEYQPNENIFILADGTPEQGIHVVMSGQGCRQFLSNDEICSLLGRVLKAGGSFSRLDLAMDDWQNVYRVQQLAAHQRKLEIMSRWHYATTDIRHRLSNGDVHREVIYFGSEQSDYNLKVYNKTLEQHQKSNVTIADVPETWVRWEFCTRRDKAQELAQMLYQAKNFYRVFTEQLDGSMRITKAEDAIQNRKRWKTRPKWERFIRMLQDVSAKQENLKAA